MANPIPASTVLFPILMRYPTMSTKSLGGAFGSLMGAVGTIAETTGNIVSHVGQAVDVLGTTIDVAAAHANEWKKVAQATAAASTDERIIDAFVQSDRRLAKMLSEVHKEQQADPVFASYYNDAAALRQRFNASRDTRTLFASEQPSNVTTLHAAE